MNKKSIAVLFPLVLMILIGAGAHSQIVYNQPAAGDVGFYYNYWKVSDSDGTNKQEATQIMVPVSGYVPLKDNFEARFYVANASHSFDYTETSMNEEIASYNYYKGDLSGMSDVRIQFSHSFKEDKILLGFGVNLPTGKQKLDTTLEKHIIEFLSRDYLNFPMRRYGEGLGINFLVGGATQIGIFKCGATAQYQYNAEYEPYVGQKLKPGNLFSLSANTNFIIDRLVYTADFIFTMYGTDEFEGDFEDYKNSPQFDGRITATFDDKPYLTQIGLRLLVNGRNNRIDATTGEVMSQLKKYGNEISAYARVVYTTGSNLYFAPIVETHKISASEEDFGKSSIFSFGINIGKPLTKKLLLDVGGRYYTGSTDSDTRDVRGTQLSGSLTTSF